MDVEFDDPNLDRLETDPRFTGKFSQGVVRGFRKVMQAIRSATDERDLYALRGLRFEKLKGQRSHQHSLRINDQWRLIVEIKENDEVRVLCVMAIEDYH